MSNRKRTVVPFNALLDWLSLGDERVADALIAAQAMGHDLVIAQADWVRYAALLRGRGLSVRAAARELELAGFSIAQPLMLHAHEEGPEALLDGRTVILKL